MLHSLSIFLAYLSLFFCVQFYVFPNSQRFLFFFSAFFTSYCHSSAPSPLSLLLSPVFFAFSSIPYCICLFSAVFFLFSAHFYLFFVYSAVSCPLFAIFQFFLHFFVSTYVTLPGSFFHVSHPSKCFTWNIVFHDFRSSAVSEKRFAFSLPESHSRFWSLHFLKQSYSLSHFGFFRIFYIFPVFSHVSRVFLSLFSLFY